MASSSKKSDTLFVTILLVFIPIVTIALLLSRSVLVKPVVRITDDFSVSFHYSTETVYRNISVLNNQITYTYFPGNTTDCKNPPVGFPCWTKSRLITLQNTLSTPELKSIHDLVADSAFLNLKKTYGGASSLTRYYPMIITAHIGNTDREITYQSFPKSAPMPASYKQVMDQLETLVLAKFP